MAKKKVIKEPLVNEVPFDISEPPENSTSGIEETLANILLELVEINKKLSRMTGG